MNPDEDGLDSLLPEALAEADPGDVVGVRSDWGAIVVAVIEQFNDKPADEFRPRDWVVIFSSPIMWDVSEGVARPVEVDKGVPVDCSPDDWDGPGVSIGVGTNRYGFELAGDVILRQPDPVSDDLGRLTHYTPLPAGRLEEVAAGGGVEAAALLKEDEYPPGAAPEVEK